MTSMLGIKSYTYGSFELGHGWNAVDIDGVRYFVDVTWNDNLNSNKYLMSTELWDDHNAADIEIKGASPCGWEIRQAEEQMEIQAQRAEEEMKMQAMMQQMEQDQNQRDSERMNSMLTDEDLFELLDFFFQDMY